MVLLLLALPLLVAAAAIEAADWVAGLPPLQILAVVPLIFWALLARSRVPWWAAHPVALVLGVVAAFVLGAFTLTEASGPGDLASQLGNWFGAAGGEGQDKGAVFTGVFLMAVTLLMSHAAVWLVYRRSAAVLPILPGLGVLLVVLTFLPSDYYWYFFMYLLASRSSDRLPAKPPLDRRRPKCAAAGDRGRWRGSDGHRASARLACTRS